jgi:hypothetical protein
LGGDAPAELADADAPYNIQAEPGQFLTFRQVFMTETILPSSTHELSPWAREAGAGTDAEFKKSAFARRLQATRRSQGPEAAAELARQTMAKLIDEQQPRIGTLPYPAEVQSLIETEFVRIRSLVEQTDSLAFDVESHSARSDFRIVGFGRVPVGVEHMEISGVPRSLLYRGGLGQFGRFLAVLARTRGVRPFYQTHMSHGVAPAHFMLVYTPRAQEQMFRRIAECLKRNPRILGLTASSWWYDPQLERISPHLVFLRTGMTEKGARMFRYGDSQSDHAVANSALRQKLRNAGEYTPVTYTMVWPRDSLIRWSDSHRS